MKKAPVGCSAPSPERRGRSRRTARSKSPNRRQTCPKSATRRQTSPKSARVVIMQPGISGVRKGKIVDAFASAIPTTHGVTTGWKVEYDDEHKTKDGKKTFGFIPLTSDEQSRLWHYEDDSEDVKSSVKQALNQSLDGISSAEKDYKDGAESSTEAQRQIRGSRGLASLARALEATDAADEEGADAWLDRPPQSHSPTQFSHDKWGSEVDADGDLSDQGGYSSYWDDEDEESGSADFDEARGDFKLHRSRHCDAEREKRSLRISMKEKIRRALGHATDEGYEDDKFESEQGKQLEHGGPTGTATEPWVLQVGELKVTEHQARVRGLSREILMKKFNAVDVIVPQAPQKISSESDSYNSPSDAFHTVNDQEKRKEDAEAKAAKKKKELVKKLLRNQRGMRKHLSELARPKSSPSHGRSGKMRIRGREEKAPATRVFSRFEDMKNCTFTPKISKAPSSMAPSSTEPQGFFEEMMAKKAGVKEDPRERQRREFIRRMDKAQLNQTRDLARAQGEHEYEFKEKKICPKCGAAQTYDQLVKREKQCKGESCGGAYFRRSKVFVRRSYEARQSRIEQQKTMKEEDALSKVLSNQRALTEAARARRHGNKHMFREWRQRLIDMGQAPPHAGSHDFDEDMLAALGMGSEDKHLEKKLRQLFSEPATLQPGASRLGRGVNPAATSNRNHRLARETKPKTRDASRPASASGGAGRANGTSRAEGVTGVSPRKAKAVASGTQCAPRNIKHNPMETAHHEALAKRQSKEKKLKQRAAGAGPKPSSHRRAPSLTTAASAKRGAPATGDRDPGAGGWEPFTLVTPEDDEPTVTIKPCEARERSPWGKLIHTDFDDGQ